MDIKKILLSLCIVFLTACGGSGGSGGGGDQSPGIDVLLQSISLSPDGNAVIEGTSVQFTARGHYDDDSSKDISTQVTWSSSDASKVEINSSGLAVAIASGVISINAEFEGVSANAVSLTVDAKILQSITVTPSAGNIIEGLTEQFTATGNYNNGTSADITSSVTWSSNNTAIASIEDTGLATAITVGSATMIATRDLIEGRANLGVIATNLQSISLTPLNANVIEGIAQQYQALGNYDNGISVDITSAVTWSSSNADIATIDNQGLASTFAGGSTSIKATRNSITATADLVVVAARLETITVTPGGASLVEGLSQQFTAMGNYDNGSSVDITSLVIWNSSNLAAAEIDSEGLAKGLAAGNSTLTATSGPVSGSAVLTVNTATLQSISITPPSFSLIEGWSLQYTAMGNYDNGTTVDLSSVVTWSSSEIAFATINSSGLATGISAGDVIIKANSDFIEATTQLTIDALVLQSISLVANNNAVVKGLTQQYQAMGSFNDDSVMDISGLVTWSSSDVFVATINSTGLATGIIAGEVMIKAQLETVAVTTALKVTDAALVSLSIIPAEQIIGTGLTQQLIAMGTFQDGSQADITKLVSWSSNNTSLLAVDGTGLATGTGEGITTIKASLGSIEGSASITVGYFDEGTAEAIPLTIGNGHLGIVAKNSSYYYAEVLPYTAYTISLTGVTDDVDLLVYDSNGNTLCHSLNLSVEDDVCSIYPQNGLVIIAAHGANVVGNGANFTVSININENYISEGAGSKTTVYLDTTHVGMVDKNTSYYQTAVAPGNAYTVNLANLTANAELYVYNTNGDIICGSSNPNSQNEACSFVAQEAEVHVYVRGRNIVGDGATYSLTVNSAVGFIAEGGENYSTGYVGIPYSGMVDKTASWYEVAVTDGVSYTVTLTGMTDDADLSIQDYAFNTLCESENLDANDESCVFIANGPTLKIGVFGNYAVGDGTRYTLTVN